MRRLATVLALAVLSVLAASPARAATAGPLRHLVVVTQQLPASSGADVLRGFGQLSASGTVLDRWPGTAGSAALDAVLARPGVTSRAYAGPAGLARFRADAGAGVLPDVALVASDGEASSAAAARAVTVSPLWSSTALVLQHASIGPLSRRAAPGSVGALAGRALLLSPFSSQGEVDRTAFDDDALAALVARTWQGAAQGSARDLGEALELSRSLPPPVLVLGAGGQGVAQPSSPTLYAGYLLALAVAGLVVGWTLLGGRRRRVMSRLRLSGRRRLRWGLARLAAAVRLTAALRRPVRPVAPVTGRRRPLPMAVVGLVVWVVVALPVAARAGGVGTEGTVRLQTVPATAGVSLLVGGVPVTTGPDGAAVTRVADLDGIAGRVRLAGTRLGATTTVALGRVVPGPHAPRESRLSVGLDVTSLVRLTVAPGTSGVPVSSVRSVRLHALTGQQLTVDPRGAPTVALLARRAQLVAGRLTSQVVTWGVERVLAGPGVAVGTTQPRFDPLGRSSWPLVLQAVRGTVAVGTVPATPGVVLLLDGATLTTGPDGTATAPVSDLNGVADRLRLDTGAAAGATVRLLHVGRLKPRAAGERRLVASLAVSRPVTLRFVDRSGAAVPASRVRAVQLDSGERVVRLTDAQVSAPVLLLAGVGTQEHGRPVARATSWSVSAVDVDGGNAVLAGGARFSASSASWRVPLAVFRVTVTARDALLGHAVGGRVVLTRPDGTTQRLTLRTDRPTVVPPVVRGTYDVALGAAVVGAHTKVLVSRDQAVEVRVVTALDAALVGGGGVLLTVAAVGGGVLLARRRRAA